MKVQDLFRSVQWPEVKEAIIRLYPDMKPCISGFAHAYKVISRCTPCRNKDFIRVQIDYVVGGDHNEDIDYRTTTASFWDVYGYCKSDQSKIGLDFSRFNQWAGFNFRKGDLAKMTRAEAVAHILWEATYHGFSDEDIKGKVRRVFGSED